MVFQTIFDNTGPQFQRVEKIPLVCSSIGFLLLGQTDSRRQVTSNNASLLAVGYDNTYTGCRVQSGRRTLFLNMIEKL